VQGFRALRMWTSANEPARLGMAAGRPGLTSGTGGRRRQPGEEAMTVYVHKLEGQSRTLTASTDAWFVLTADTGDDLHAFAASLGLTRIMFRPGTPAGPHQEPVAAHYDVTMGERDRAVALGARPITRGEADRMERQRAAGLGYS
jgi:hypothetical protein